MEREQNNLPGGKSKVNSTSGAFLVVFFFFFSVLTQLHISTHATIFLAPHLREYVHAEPEGVYDLHQGEGVPSFTEWSYRRDFWQSI